MALAGVKRAIARAMFERRELRRLAARNFRRSICLPSIGHSVYERALVLLS
jgi:hypothetical protein